MNTRLADFIAFEQREYPDAGANLFAFALSQAARYDSFLHVIVARYDEVRIEFQGSIEGFIARLSEYQGKELNADDMRDWSRHSELTELLHLEIESFYLFAKIFLDHIARFIEAYFGPERRLSLDSHDDLTKSFQRFREAKGLRCSDEFQQTLERLKSKIADYRDYHIAHSKNPRLSHGTTWGPNNEPEIMRVPFFSTKTGLQGTQSASEGLSDLRAVLDAYIELVIALITDNRDKSRYLKSPTVAEMS
jgi:hypothetical protein